MHRDTDARGLLQQCSVSALFDLEHHGQACRVALHLEARRRCGDLHTGNIETICIKSKIRINILLRQVS